MTSSALERLISEVERQGWVVQRFGRSLDHFPSAILARFGALPADYVPFLERVASCVAPDAKAWFLTMDDFSGTSSAAFAWNQWENMSMDAAVDEPELLASISSFWQRHLPIYFSLRSGYEYYAIGRDGAVVQGYEPDFEEVTTTHATFVAFLEAVASGAVP